MVEWKPIPEAALRNRVAQGEARMSLSHLRLWQVLRIEPEKWQQHPYGDSGGGFWVVAIVGRTVIWYNDLEDGFNRSRYSTYGTIDDYWCNQDELDLTMQYLISAIEQSADLVRLKKPPAKVPR